jgi:hypothetical protein
LTGTIADARFPATLPVASGANLTSLPAGNLTGTYSSISATSDIFVGGLGDPATIGNMVKIESGGRVSSARNGSTSLALYRQGSDAGQIAQFHYNTTPVGDIRVATSSTSYNTSSDYRLKENVVPISGAIERINQLKPSRFNFISDPNKVVDGFIAHEAQEVVPEAVAGEKDAMRMEEYEVTPAEKDGDGKVTQEAVIGEREVPDMQGIDQAKLVPLLVGALQEAIGRIETLEREVVTLKEAL